MKIHRRIAVFTFLITMLMAVAKVSADLNDGLVAHYPFDGNANDVSVYGNHGTPTNMDLAAVWVAGKIGQAVDFDGNDDIIIVNYDPSLEPSTELTISAWLRTPTGRWGDDNIISKDVRIGSFSSNTPSPGYLLRTSNPEDEMLFFAGGFKPHGPPVTTNEWVHVVGTYSGNPKRMALYINADSCFDHPFCSERTDNLVPSSISYTGGNNLGIGGPFDISGFGYFDGMIDDLRIYNRSLSNFEIKDLFYMGSAVKVSIDIKPKSCPNSFNLKSNMQFTVAILGNWDFDVRDIDITTIEFNGLSPIKISYDDVTAPAASINDECFCEKLDPDSFEDLVLKFDTQEIIASLGNVQDGDEIILSLLAKLEDGETLIRGTDCVLIRKRQEKDDNSLINSTYRKLKFGY